MNKLSPKNLSKILLFSILQIPFCLFLGIGILPNLVLLVGFFRAKQNKKQNILLSSIKFYKYYVYIVCSLTILISVSWTLLVKFQYWSPYVFGYVIGSSLMIFLFFATSLMLLEFLFKRPLLEQK